MEPPKTILNSSQFQSLKSEFEILHLLYYRNKNQHRRSVWWKYLSILHRRSRRILNLSNDQNNWLIQKGYSVDGNNEKSLNKKKWEKKDLMVFQNQSKMIMMDIRFLYKNIFPKAFQEFNGIIALGHFVVLGLSLLASLSTIYSLFLQLDILKPPIIEKSKEIESPDYKSSSDNFDNIVDENIDDDLGKPVNNNDLTSETFNPAKGMKRESTSVNNEAVTYSLDLNPSTVNVNPERKNSSRKKKKKHKKKSAIDDIFGF